MYQNRHLKNLQVIVGLGKTGLSCVQFLARQNISIAITDSREYPPGLIELQAQFPDIPVSLGKLDENLCAKASRLIVSPGVSLKEPAIAQALEKGISVVGDITLFSEVAKAPIAAITGSNGKSTVTILIAEMARQSGLVTRVGGNLGTPALTLLSDSEPDLYVLELSSFQLETTERLNLKAAVLLNLSEDHMDRYSSLTDYLTAKQRIYKHCEIKIVNRDQPDIWQNDLDTNSTLLSFGLGEPHLGEFGLRKYQERYYLAKGEILLLCTDTLKIKGKHQLANALAALAVGEAIGLPMPSMLETLRYFSGLPHRCQWVANYNGVDWYNDSKATNVGAAQAALIGLGSEIKGKLVVIAGGQGKNADFTPLRVAIETYARCLILMGQDAQLMEEALIGTTEIKRANYLEEAILMADQAAKPGDTVILAPACASLDMFTNFEHRGEAFMEGVKNLVNPHPPYFY